MWVFMIIIGALISILAGVEILTSGDSLASDFIIEDEEEPSVIVKKKAERKCKDRASEAAEAAIWLHLAHATKGKRK